MDERCFYVIDKGDGDLLINGLSGRPSVEPTAQAQADKLAMFGGLQKAITDGWLVRAMTPDEEAKWFPLREQPAEPK